MKKLNNYQGKLSPAQIAAGMNAAVSNAKRLAEDATLLLEAERFPSATALAALSIEEAGKVSILRALAVAKDEKEVAAHWKEYRTHTKKNALWILPELVAGGADRLEDFRMIFESDRDHPYLLNKVQQLGFYTDCFGQAHWSLPERVIDETVANSLVWTAKLLSTGEEKTALEVELWIKHIGPVWKKQLELMEEAVTNWHQEMYERGLAQEKDGLARFINEGLRATQDL